VCVSWAAQPGCLSLAVPSLLLHRECCCSPGKRRSCTLRRATGDEQKEGHGYQFGDLFLNKLTGKDKYEFGDLSRFIGGKLKDAACEITGKEDYEFGDVSRVLDKRAKEEVCKVTGKDSYKFGDLTFFLDKRAKEEVCKMTGKDSYEIGDITREIVRRVQAGEVDQEELSLLLRGALAFGVGLSPVAQVLPAKLLIQALTWNLQEEVNKRVAGRVSTALAEELDRRAKSAVLGEENANYVLGDFTRAQLRRALHGITGKEDYQFGDISKAVLEKIQQQQGSVSH